MTVEKFEDRRIWLNARIQADSIYNSFSHGSPSGCDFGFRDQIQRCAVSVMNKIAEGFERKSDPGSARFLDIAKGSNGGLRSMLYLAEVRIYLRSEVATLIRNSSEDISRGIESLAKNLRRSWFQESL